jgi:hypothetical protein
MERNSTVAAQKVALCQARSAAWTRHRRHRRGKRRHGGLYDIVDEPMASNFVESIGYLRGQGYGTRATDIVWWRNFNPMDLARNVAGAGTRLMLSAGDNCAFPTDTADRAARSAPGR